MPISLKEISVEIRESIVKMLVEAGSGHIAGPLGMTDTFAVLYFGDVMKFNPQNPLWEERDRLVISNGHICPVLYASMAQAGYFSLEELSTLRKFESRLQGHPHRLSLPGIETSSGPLGSGLSQAAGMAYVAKTDNFKWRVICIGSDGEHQEGNWWEGVMFAGKNKLSNLTQVIDRNNIQIDGFTEDIMPLEPLKEKYEAFNWEVLEVDGNNIGAFVDAVREAKAITEKPTVIIAHTIPGKGVDFMEKDFRWHGKPPNKEGAKEALDELRTLQGKIQSEHE